MQNFAFFIKIRIDIIKEQKWKIIWKIAKTNMKNILKLLMII